MTLSVLSRTESFRIARESPACSDSGQVCGKRLRPSIQVEATRVTRKLEAGFYLHNAVYMMVNSYFGIALIVCGMRGLILRPSPKSIWK